tara:strand:+ start:28 stop:351 length:324 start_codon:yes stop_codon:yes gene_type:complete
MPGNPYNNQNPNHSFFNLYVEQFQNQNQSSNESENQNQSSRVIVTDTEFQVGNKTLTRTCPHNGCLLNYNSSQNRFICPCHASTFNLNGDCLNGPACPKSILKNSGN